MGQIKRPVHDEGAVNAGEQRLQDFLATNLPDNYYIIPNLNMSIQGPNHIARYWEYDCIVVAPHAIYHIENKDWGGYVEGDDWAWFRSGQEVANPHKTANFKSRILAGKIRDLHPDWRIGQILTAVTLSNPNQSKFGFDPQCDCYNQTFILNQSLVEFITNYELAGRREEQIKDLQLGLTNLLTGESVSRRRDNRTEIFGYRIKEILQETENFTEYLCVPKLIESANYKIREYPLDIADMSPSELQNLELRVQNAYMAQEKIGDSPYIVKTECRMNEGHTYYYEISRYQEEGTLQSKLRQKAFKQTDKIGIILDIAYALKEAHKQSVFHRNVCPENIYVYEGGKAALANFDMAWFIEHTDLKFTVKSGNDLESPYIAPELLDGDVCRGSDIYSLGVVFYELMVGELPFANVVAFSAGMGGRLPEDRLPSHINNDLPKWMDELVNHTIVLDVSQRWQDADEFISFVREKVKDEKGPNDSISDLEQADSGTSKHLVRLDDMKPGVNVTPAMTLHEMLGKGGYGRVFKVWHSMQNQHLAIKIFELGLSVDNAINEFMILKKLNHPNIVRFIYIDRTQQGLFYTLMELLDGENLSDYTKGDLRLPAEEVYKMAIQILSALVYMQEDFDPPVYHRDIKPSNIVWHKRETYKLIDFNIATTTNDKSFNGTLPYLAPDLIAGSKVNWDKSADTFALGVTIYELLAHAYPWQGSNRCPNANVEATDIQLYNTKLTDEMSRFVMKAVCTDRSKRFKTAKEMMEALENIGDNGILKDDVTRTPSTFGDDSIDAVGYINSLYSQSRHGNSGTRATLKVHRLDELTYTETKLDKELINDIKELKYKLIVITGNAGDGKTAFIHRIENAGYNNSPCDSGNGSHFYINGVHFVSNYDGSQDEADKYNDDVLTDFFKPFSGLTDYSQLSEGRVIAINEGRLVDFLSNRDELRNLRENIEEYFYQEGHSELLPGLMVINLNLRSVTARESNAQSLLAQQVKKLTCPELWSMCATCPIADKCFIKYNVDTFQDSSAGDEVISRLEWLVRTIVYKRELHITMRDLRSTIAWMLTRDHSCEEVKKLVTYIECNNSIEYYWQYFYFNLTAPEAELASQPDLPSLYSSDRLVRLLRETDVAGVVLPSYDRDLYYKNKVANDYIVFSDRKSSLLDEFNAVNCVIPTYESKSDSMRTQVSGRHKSFVRHQYFEGKFDFRRRLPYRSASNFYERLKGDQAMDDTMKDIARAISISEGCDNMQLSNGYLLLASSNSNDPISKSYRRFPLDEFELFVNKTDHLTKYIEYESDSLIFRHKTDKFIQLTVGLDLYEMLQYIREGFSPSANDLRGKFIELQIFKNLLEAKTYSEILVTRNNRKFTVVRFDEMRRIVVEPLNV